MLKRLLLPACSLRRGCAEAVIGENPAEGKKFRKKANHHAQQFPNPYSLLSRQRLIDSRRQRL